MKANAALERSDCGVELYAVTGVDTNLTLVINPRNTELELTLRLSDSLKDSLSLVLLFIGLDYGLQGLENLGNGLNELGLACILLLYELQHFINIRHR